MTRYKSRVVLLEVAVSVAVILQNEGHLVVNLVRHELLHVRNCVEWTISIEATLAKMLQQFQTWHSVSVD